MCRSKDSGGRRCPQHTDPVKHAAYNARRRELYAERKGSIKSAVSTLFPPLGEPRVVPNILDGSLDSYYDESNDFRDIVWPEYTEEGWEELSSTENWVPENSPAEAIQYYCTHGHTSYRAFLMGKLKPESVIHTNTAIAVEHMNSALKRAPKPKEPRRLYRGMTLRAETMEGESLESYIGKNFPVGGTVAHQSFMSTSLYPDIAHSFTLHGFRGIDSQVLFEIVSKQGAPVADGLSASTHEYEVIMPHNTKFRVAGVHHNAEFSYTKRSFSETPEAKTYRNMTIIQLEDVGE